MENSYRTEVVSMEAEPSGVIVTNFDILHENEFSDIGGKSADLIQYIKAEAFNQVLTR